MHTFCKACFTPLELDEVAVHRLQETVREHPYFGAAHFLLAQKLKHEQAGQYETQVQRAAVYFHDPLWMHWQLGQQEKIETPEIVPEPIVEEPVVEEPLGEEPIVEEPAVEELPVEEPPVEEPIVEEPVIPEPVPVVQEVVAEHMEKTNGVEETRLEKPVEQPVEQPVFEPYYTIDYFAHQGIKPPTEVLPGDKLGKQLKSFTEWLKTMKRLPQVPVEPPSEAEQQHIRRFAAGSLEKKEVVTETMAEVLVKQDKKGEAIVIYEKLSLLDPSKSAYFAAKIEES